MPDNDRPEDDLDDDDLLEEESAASEAAKKAEWPRDFGSEADDIGADPRGLRGVPDMLRKAMVAGLGAVFMTEEGVRSLVRDLKLPKEVIGFIVGQAEKSKGELMRVMGDELRRFFESPVLRQELIKLLSEVTIEVKAEVRLKPDPSRKTSAIEPDVKVAEANIKRSGKKSKS